MHNMLSEQQESLLKRGFSRRNFGRIATLVGAGATLPFYNEFALAQRAAGGRRMMFDMPPDAVRINASLERVQGGLRQILSGYRHKATAGAN